MSPIRASERRRYPADWPAISARIRFTRAAGQCECTGECGTGHGGRCTARHGRPHPVTGSRVVLTTAHLDHVPEHCDDANLRAMCQRCHLAYDAGQHAATRAAAAALDQDQAPGVDVEDQAPGVDEHQDQAAGVDQDQAAGVDEVFTARRLSAVAAGSAVLPVLVPWLRSLAAGFRVLGGRCRADLCRYIRQTLAGHVASGTPGACFRPGFRRARGA